MGRAEEHQRLLNNMQCCICVSQQEVLRDKIKYCKSDERTLSLPETDLSDHSLFFFGLNSDPVRSLYPSLNHSHPSCYFPI